MHLPAANTFNSDVSNCHPHITASHDCCFFKCPSVHFPSSASLFSCELSSLSSHSLFPLPLSLPPALFAICGVKSWWYTYRTFPLSDLILFVSPFQEAEDMSESLFGAAGRGARKAPLLNSQKPTSPHNCIYWGLRFHICILLYWCLSAICTLHLRSNTNCKPTLALTVRHYGHFFFMKMLYWRTEELKKTALALLT